MYILSPKRLVAPFFSRFQRWVCRASKVMMDDGTSVEDAVSEIAQSGGSGSGGSGMLKLSLCGSGEQVAGGVIHHIAEGLVEEDDYNIVPKSQVDAIVAAPFGSTVIICSSWINDDGNFVDSQILGFGITTAPESSSYDCELSCVDFEEALPNLSVRINQANGRLLWYSGK